MAFFSSGKIHDRTLQVRLAAETAECQRTAGIKIWKLNTSLKVTGWVLGILALVLLLWACWTWSSVALITLGTIGTTVALVIVGAIFGKTVMRVVRYRDTLTEIATGVAMSLVGWILARIHLHVFDKWYLHAGRLRE